MERETGQDKSKKIIATAAVLVVAAGIAGFLVYKADNQLSPKEKTLLEQKKKLDQLRAEREPLTPEQINSQKKKLDSLRSKSEPLSQEQLKKQKEALNKLRNNNQ